MNVAMLGGSQGVRRRVRVKFGLFGGGGLVREVLVRKGGGGTDR